MLNVKLSKFIYFKCYVFQGGIKDSLQVKVEANRWGEGGIGEIWTNFHMKAIHEILKYLVQSRVRVKAVDVLCIG